MKRTILAVTSPMTALSTTLRTGSPAPATGAAQARPRPTDRSIRGVALLVALVSLPLSISSAAADDAETCRQAGDDAIAACARRITSGKLTSMPLAPMLTNRGVAYERKGEYHRADLDEAIRLDPKYAPRYVVPQSGALQADAFDHRYRGARSSTRLHAKSDRRHRRFESGTA
jgi:hypothetical protein